jgi:hypothetical protein
MSTPTYDTVIIGAGWAGTAALDELTAKGQNVLLLETHDRLGGRTHVETLEVRGEEIAAEMGAGFIGTADTVLWKVLHRTYGDAGNADVVDGAAAGKDAYGPGEFPSYVEIFNNTRYVYDMNSPMGFLGSGIPTNLSTERYTILLGVILTLEAFEAALTEWMESWSTPFTPNLATQPAMLQPFGDASVADWLKAVLAPLIKGSGATPADAEFIINLWHMAVLAPWSREPAKIDFLYWLHFNVANGGFMNVVNDDAGGPQQYRLLHGFETLLTDFVSQILEKHPASALRLNARVASVTQVSSHQVKVSGSDLKTGLSFDVLAGSVIVAMSPTSASHIAYNGPPLKAAKSDLWWKQQMGVTIKTTAFFTQPWWRRPQSDVRGYQGYASSDQQTFKVPATGADHDLYTVWVMDCTPPNEEVYGFFTFIVGDRALQLMAEAKKTGVPFEQLVEQRTAADIALLFNVDPSIVYKRVDDGGQCLGVLSQSWYPGASDGISIGGPFTFFASAEYAAEIGVARPKTQAFFSSMADFHAPEFGSRLIFAGTEYAAEHLGYMSGAFIAGQQAAAQVIAGAKSHGAACSAIDIARGTKRKLLHAAMVKKTTASSDTLEDVVKRVVARVTGDSRTLLKNFHHTGRLMTKTTLQQLRSVVTPGV